MFDNFDDEDDFDFEDYMNESQKEFQSNLEAYRHKLFIDAIETNYSKIKEYGISDWHLRNMEVDELKSLQDTLNTMIEHFIEGEEYEKCALLQKHLDNVNFALQKTRTASQDI